MYNISEVAFYGLSTLAIFSALMVVFSRNPVHSVLYLVVCFFAISGHFLLLNAQFLFVVNIIVYAGAIMVLFLFTIMMLNLNRESEPHKNIILKLAAVVSGCLLLLVLVAALKGAETTTAMPIDAIKDPNIGLVKNLGKELFTRFVLPFEISSILFIAAMVGTVMLGKKKLT
ncbi:MAG: NADH-quinone oxidoreductase subunit J [Bacteroidetes bacterium]|nr:NADH-quinone oxidoreductase subunit J [Bacteroidota bacterium]